MEQEVTAKTFKQISCQSPISDGIVSISFTSFTVYSIKTWDENSFFENYFILQTLINVAVVLSMLNFTLITADRLIAVKWPFFYEDRIHTKQPLIAITVVWGITIVHAIVIITLFNVLHPHTSRYFGNVTFVVIVITGFITFLISNSFAFVEARRQLRATEKITCSIVNLSVEPRCKSNNKDREFPKNEFRLVRMSIGLILCFFLFWINVTNVTIKMLVYADEMEPPIRTKYIITSWYLVRVYYMCNPL